MRGILILLAIVTLAVSPASAATTITWGVDVTDNGDGSSRYLIKAKTDDRAIVGFTGNFYCNETVAQILGDPTMPPGGPIQIDKYTDALMAHYMDPGYDMDKDSFVWSAFDFVPATWTETATSYGGDTGSSPPWDSDQGMGDFVGLVQLVAPTGLDFETAIDEGDFGYRGNLGLWAGPGHSVVKTDASFGVVPEPATIVLLGVAGLLGLLAMLRRRLKTCDI